MKHFLLCLVLTGCVQSESSLVEDYLLDNQLENGYYEEEDIIEPGTFVVLPTLEVDLWNEIPPSISFDDQCVCEWDMWREGGLICMGIVCSNACPPEVSECHETRQACVPR